MISLHSRFHQYILSFSTTSNPANATHFGNILVDKSEKQGKVNQVFSSVAQKYDLMNDVMSGGIHRLWKDYFVSNVLMPSPDMEILDLAGGTGDIAFRILNNMINPQNILSCDLSPNHFIKSIPDTLQSLPNFQNSPMVSNPTPKIKGHITVSDINTDMLTVGQQRASNMSIPFNSMEDIKSGNIKEDSSMSWIPQDAHCLTFDDNSFDAYTIAFGIRNCTDISKVLDEAYRVLKPGGRFLCLEFSHVKNPVLSQLYDVFSFGFIPFMGQIFANDSQSYQYLVESIRKFPQPEAFSKMIGDSGFQNVSFEPLNFGIVAIHSGLKLE